ncbi:hypothetical protein F5J12DRAFT_785716 [Pisolithus orientalis]|uniref:uncharacterized protein n=1 Tax=Pisolithus orientalis TaxID=936130 RepID=UPI0022245A9F|nr:uncharacterized protein F5J12DRAFT_785716 [Pisolithus orientalis]KAI5994916.1 hypothetical protein F5J12DRAFT_785716 [Pisolithus orientalis]
MQEVPQPEERLAAIHKWVDEWDVTWANIYLWWQYMDEHKIAIPDINARGNGQDHRPGDVEAGGSTGGAVHLTGGGLGSESKGKGKERAPSKEDELDNEDKDKDKGNRKEPGPSMKGPQMTGEDKSCEACAQSNLICIGELGLSCKWCRNMKHKCMHALRVGRKQKNSGTVGVTGPSHK